MINNLNQPANYAQNFKDIWASNHQIFAEPQRNFKYHNSNKEGLYPVKGA